MFRTEVRSKSGNSHLGHVFTDGLKIRWIEILYKFSGIKFIPKDKMKDLGYEDYLDKVIIKKIQIKLAHCLNNEQFL